MDCFFVDGSSNATEPHRWPLFSCSVRKWQMLGMTCNSNDVITGVHSTD